MNKRLITSTLRKRIDKLFSSGFDSARWVHRTQMDLKRAFPQNDDSANKIGNLFSPENVQTEQDLKSAKENAQKLLLDCIEHVEDLGIEAETIKLHNVYIPTAFTPNGDGVNDYFEIFGNKQAWKYVQVNIFDRWGEMVYESNDLDFKWDGTYKGQVEEPGMYVYEIIVTFADGYSLNKNKGSISLIR